MCDHHPVTTSSGTDPKPQTYRLVNAEDRHREAPRHFFIPDKASRSALIPGDVAKLLFEPVEAGEDGPFPERMWVEVTEVCGRNYCGILTNEPFQIPQLEHGAPVAFGPEHVIALQGYGWELLLDLDILVTQRSDGEDRRPEIIFREDPVYDGDSGWRAIIGDETGGDEILPQQAGFFLQRWPEVRAVLESNLTSGFWKWNKRLRNYLPTNEELLFS